MFLFDGRTFEEYPEHPSSHFAAEGLEPVQFRLCREEHVPVG